MRYAKIDKYEVVNGQFGGISLYVQGCQWRCHNCFNPETWDFNGGKEWTEEIKNEFLKLIDRPYIKRVSLLGGSPLADKNLDDVLSLVMEIKDKFPNKTLWVYSGYEWEDIWSDSKIVIDDYTNKVYEDYKKRQKIISYCNVMVDGRYIEELKDISLHWRGSSNQRVIDVQQSLKKGEIVLWSN